MNTAPVTPGTPTIAPINPSNSPNRTIFIGCNSPNKLVTLDLLNISNYSSINLQQFKSLQKFHQSELPQWTI